MCRTEERPHALRPLNPSFSQIVDRWSWSSITIVNRGSLPQIVLFNDHGSFKPINDHDRKLKKRRSRIVVFANDRRSSLSPTTADRFRHRRSQIVSPTTVVIAVKMLSPLKSKVNVFYLKEISFLCEVQDETYFPFRNSCKNAFPAENQGETCFT